MSTLCLAGSIKGLFVLLISLVLNRKAQLLERIICKYIGDRPGPLLLVFGSMHGNEPAGAKALELVNKMLEVEPITNEGFSYRGAFVGMLGNKQAVEQNERFLERDLNRSWTVENVQRISKLPKHELQAEDLEMAEILQHFDLLIKELNPTKVIVLDLHTTSSFGGIFTLPTDDEESIRIAKALHAPVIKGMLEGIKGTVLHYFNSENLGVDTTALAFESGQHNEKLSVNRAIAAIVNCMRTIQAIDPNHVEHQHDKILKEYSRSLPKVAQLVTKYGIKEVGAFKMKPNFKNFQPVSKGEALAYDAKELVVAPDDGLILMPLYQKRGEDGFFLIKELEN